MAKSAVENQSCTRVIAKAEGESVIDVIVGLRPIRGRGQSLGACCR